MTPAVPFRLLTVCIGNICRSPLAERLFDLNLGASLDRGCFAVASAGVRGMAGSPMHPLAAAELERLGGASFGFSAQRFTSETARDVDLVLSLTRDIRAEVLREEPRAMKRTFTLLEFAALCRLAVDDNAAIHSFDDLLGFAVRHRSRVAGFEQDVVDPIGRSEDVHRAVANQIADAVRVVSALLVPILRD